MDEEVVRYVQGKCRHPQCGAVVDFALNGLDVDEFKQRVEKVNSYECPGGPHMELGNLLRGYDWDWTIRERTAPPSDEQWIAQLATTGYRVLCGMAGKHTELPNLHDLKGLEHMGFGDFASPSNYYERRDSPTGMRFYLEIPKTEAKGGGDE